MFCYNIALGFNNNIPSKVLCQLERHAVCSIAWATLFDCKIQNINYRSYCLLMLQLHLVDCAIKAATILASIDQSYTGGYIEIQDAVNLKPLSNI